MDSATADSQKSPHSFQRHPRPSRWFDRYWSLAGRLHVALDCLVLDGTHRKEHSGNLQEVI